MTTIIDEENVAHEIYEGAPDDLRRHIDGSHDEMSDIATHMRSFTAPTQNGVRETIEWYNEEASSPPFDPDGMCLKVCRTARNIGPMYASALEAQQATPEDHRVHKISNIRRGMVVYFDTVGDSNPYGHIVTVAGRDKNADPSKLSSLIVWTNSVLANRLVKVRGDYFAQHWGDDYQFAATWLNGQELKFPEPKPEPERVERFMNVKAMHISMRTFLSDKSWEQDSISVLRRARSREFAWITGTEAGKADHREILREIASDYDFALRFGERNDSWIAVNRSFADGQITSDYFPVISEPRDRGILVTSFNKAELGRITIAAAHYVRFGRPDAKSPDYEIYLRENKQLAKKLAEVAKQYGAGKDLFFYGGDQNIPDKVSDTFFGGPLTSSWDELAKWQNTGHGNIDVIASFNGDRRVEAQWVRRLRDTEFHLHSDHYLVETGFRIGLLTA